MTDYRRHHASNPAVIVVFEGGSPETIRRTKPGRYPHQQREAWRPQRAIPNRKAEALRKLLERMSRQNEEVRAFMASARRAAFSVNNDWPACITTGFVVS